VFKWRPAGTEAVTYVNSLDLKAQINESNEHLDEEDTGLFGASVNCPVQSMPSLTLNT